MFIYASIACRKSPPQGYNHSFFFFGGGGGDRIGLTLGGKMARLKPNRYSFNPQVDLLVCVCRSIFTSERGVSLRYLSPESTNKERNTL